MNNFLGSGAVGVGTSIEAQLVVMPTVVGACEAHHPFIVISLYRTLGTRHISHIGAVANIPNTQNSVYNCWSIFFILAIEQKIFMIITTPLLI